MMMKIKKSKENANVQVAKKSKMPLRSDSMLFIHLFDCFCHGKHSHMLRYASNFYNEVFEMMYVIKHANDWDGIYMNLYQKSDSIFFIHLLDCLCPRKHRHMLRYASNVYNEVFEMMCVIKHVNDWDGIYMNLYQKSNPMLFIRMLDCLTSEKCCHMLRCVSTAYNEEFGIMYLNKHIRDWDGIYMSLFEVLFPEKKKMSNTENVRPSTERPSMELAVYVPPPIKSEEEYPCAETCHSTPAESRRESSEGSEATSPKTLPETRSILTLPPGDAGRFPPAQSNAQLEDENDDAADARSPEDSRDVVQSSRQRLLEEREMLKADRKTLLEERQRLISQRFKLIRERDRWRKDYRRMKNSYRNLMHQRGDLDKILNEHGLGFTKLTETIEGFLKKLKKGNEELIKQCNIVMPHKNIDV